MGGDGVTKVVSRRLPREIAEDGGETEAEGALAPPPFAGVAASEDEAKGDDTPPHALGEQAAAPRPGSVEAA